MSAERILIVDGDPRPYTMLRAILKHRFDIRVAQHAEGCRQALAERHPMLILLNMRMEGIAAFQICADLKSQVAKPPAVIFTCPHATQEERMDAYALGADDFITQDISREEMYCRVEKVIKTYQYLASSRRCLGEMAASMAAARAESEKYQRLTSHLRAILHANTNQELAAQLQSGALSLGIKVQLRLGADQDSVTVSNLPIDEDHAEHCKSMQYGALCVTAHAAEIDALPYSDLFDTMMQLAAQRATLIAAGKLQRTLHHIGKLADTQQAQLLRADVLKEIGALTVNWGISAH